MRIRKSIAIAAAGAVAVVGLGSTGAVAGKMVGSASIKKDAVKSKHIADGTIKAKDLKPNLKSKIQEAAKGAKGPAESLVVKHASLEDAVNIEKIGGSINDDNTDLETGLTLEAGTYVVTVDGAFQKVEGAADFAVDIYPQISLWIDRTPDEEFDWKEGEGDISPNALMPNAAERHISVSGTTVITLEEETYVGLLGFGYAANKSSQGSGAIDVIDATITASKIG